MRYSGLRMWRPPGPDRSSPSGAAGLLGTTSVAVGLARNLSRRTDTLLVDANVHAPSVGDLLNVRSAGCSPRACRSTAAPEDRRRRGVHPTACAQRRRSAVCRRCIPGDAAGPADRARTVRTHPAGRGQCDRPGGEIGLVPDWTTARRWDYGPPITSSSSWGSLRWPSSGCGAACLLRPI